MITFMDWDELDEHTHIANQARFRKQMSRVSERANAIGLDDWQHPGRHMLTRSGDSPFNTQRMRRILKQD